MNGALALAPWADAHYAGDYGWFEAYPELWRDFAGEMFSRNPDAAAKCGATLVPFERTRGLGREGVATAGNSGHQAVNLAVLMGANPVFLLGFDMQPDGKRHHFHGNHERNALTNPNAQLYRQWRTNLLQLHDEALAEGVEVINCTRRTALDLPRETLEGALCRISSGSPRG